MAAAETSEGFVPPPYPQDRLADLEAVADALPGGMVDCSVGTPVDPTPELALVAARDASRAATGYPPSIGTVALRTAAADWIGRRFGVTVAPGSVTACVGTKEVVASIPRMLSLRHPGRSVVLYPAVSYPTYAMGAELAGLRAVAVPVDGEWKLDLAAVDPAEAADALILWCNDPANPTGAGATASEMAATVAWARERGIIVASDECYAEFTASAPGVPAPPVTALAGAHDGVLAVHSLSKRSNMAGFRVGFVAGDPELVRYLGEVRKHAGLIVPTPAQAAAAAALGDDVHVEEQRARYAKRWARLAPALEAHGLVHDGGPSGFYLWLRDASGADDGWTAAARLAELGLLVAPGDLYGAAGHRHARLALSIPDDRVELAVERLDAAR
jgi:succinyldiaminopimelate transaminase